MIDLHIHSTYSDGTFSVIEILEKAQKNNVTALSITDHNTVEAYNELKEDTVDIFSGRIIKGVEIDCIYNNSKIELLGYDFNRIDILENWLKSNYSPEKQIFFRKKEYERLLEKMQKHGIINNCSARYDEVELPHTAVYLELKKHDYNKAFLSEEEWNDFVVFFRTATTNRNSLFFIDYSDIVPSAKEVSETIRKAGGKAFLAHVFSYGIDNHIQFINNLSENSIIDGVEVFYSKFTDYERNELYTYCKNNKLYMSGGSDSHGDKSKFRNIGSGYGNLSVPESILDEWMNDK